MDRLAAKLIALGVLIVLTLTFSVIPYFLVLRSTGSLASDRRRDKVIAIFNCFGGGVFLATLLLHLTTEGAEEFETYKSKAGWKSDFPLFNIFVACGFFLVAFIEFFLHAHLHHKTASHTHELPQSEANHSQEPGNTFESQYMAVGSQRKRVESRTGFPTPIQKDSACAAHETDRLLPRGCDHQSHKSDYVVVGPDSRYDVADRVIQRKHELQGCEIVSVETEYIDRGSGSVSGITDINTEAPNGLRAFLLLFALSFHTIFDGLAVGLQGTVSEVWQVFMAISIHKSIIAFCLGLEIFKSHLDRPWRAFAWVCFFSLMSPIGIGLGIGLTSSGINELAKLLSSSILQGIAAGTFLYVTFLEILSLYIGHNVDRKFMHIFSAMVGFIFMACMKLLDNE